jgi:ribosomal protein L15
MKNPVTLKVHRITKAAKAKIEAAGGTVELIV